MPTVRQMAAWYASEVRKGNGDLHTPQPVIMEREDAKRKKNAPDDKGKRKTRIVWEAGDPDVYAAFHAERSRYMGLAANNPVLATEMMLIVLKLHPDEEITRYQEALQSVRSKVNQ